VSCGSPVGLTRRPVSTPCSSNRTCGFPCIRLSDKASRLRPRRAPSKLGKTYEPVLLVEVLGQIGARPPSGFPMLASKPPTQPHRRVAVDRPVRLARGPYREGVGPSAQRPVDLGHQHCGILPGRPSLGERVDGLHGSADALPRRPIAHAGDRVVLDQAYADAMLALARANPALDDLAVLAAEAAMNTSPWNYWNIETGEPQPLVGEAVGIIEAVMQRNPTHPQAEHLYIHLLELPEPKKAEVAADRLRDNRPGALGHLVHMPAHIYYRSGRYEDSLNANIAAAAADEAYLAEAGDDPMVRFGYYPHNVHFLLTSAQMMGDVETVVTQAAKLRQVIDVDTGRELAWVQAIYAAPYFALAQYGSPASILALTDKALPLEYVEAMRRYARAVASAQAGDQQAFERELVALTELGNSPAMKAMESAGFPGPVLVGIAGEVAQGRMALARNRPETAIDHFTRAADMQKSVPYMEPPFWYYPVNQSLGAAYFSAGRYNEARDAFRAALFDAPNSALALYGLAQTENDLGTGWKRERRKRLSPRFGGAKMNGWR